jgi:CHAT domain
LPLRCLTAAVGARPPYDLKSDLANVIPNPGVNVPRAFQIAALSGTAEEALAEAGSNPSELVLLWVTETGVLSPDSLAAFVRTTGIRLLMLHFEDTRESAPRADAYTQVIREAQQQGASAIIVTNGSEAASGYFYFRLFEQIVHDQPIDIAFFRSQGDVRPLSASMISRLFLSRGGEDVLRLSLIAEKLRADAEDAILEIQARFEEGSISPGGAAMAMNVLQDIAVRSELLNWDHESGGLIPLAELKEELNPTRARGLLQGGGGASEIFEIMRSPAREIYTQEPDEPRVINVSFLGRKGIVPSQEPLSAGTRYDFRLQIGRHLPESIVRNPAPVPEALLAPLMPLEGLALRVVLSSRQFELIDEEFELVLPPQGPSEMIRFRVRTPSETGTAQLRAAVYYQTNLLQSIRVTAEVIPGDSLAAGTNSAEVEYCICGTMRNFEMYEPRALSLLLNESRDGTHTFAIVGSQIRESFSFTEGEMRGSLQEARKTLLAICADFDQSGNATRYRYDSTTNAGLPAQFQEDVKKLAYAGRDLYTVFVTNKNQVFAQELRRALAHRSEIQIASTRSAKYVFPWGLVYDKLLVEDRSNTVCDRFLSDIARPDGDFDCLSSGCPNADDYNVICPSGFWGYRHVVEQPPSIAEDEKTPGRDLPMCIDLHGDPTVIMGVSLELEFPEAHYKQLSGVGSYRIELARDKGSIVKALLSKPARNLVYFYCHGGSEDGKAFLGIGNKQRLLTGDLIGCGLSWPESHPLVFINGCRTAELSPDDLLTFITTFAYCQAAGVIGAEITIPESLAREFATHFFTAMLQPNVSVGEVIRRERLSLLKKYNLLGLAYTPFCHSSLHFAQRT